MADHQQGPAVVGQRVDELVDAGEVEVVGRFVEHDQLCRWFGEQQPGQHHPEPFPAGQGAHPAVHGVAAQQEPRELCADGLGVRRRGSGAHRVQDGGVLVEPVEALREVADPVGAQAGAAQ